MKEDSVAWLRKAAENLRDFYKTSDPEAAMLEEVATEIEHLRAENVKLRAELANAIDLAEEGWDYVRSPYFLEKWTYDGRLAMLKAVLGKHDV